MTTSTQHPLDVTAVLMAGGQSSRMGRDKALLNHGGRPLWQVQLEKLSFAREVLISARETTFSTPPPGTRLIFDEIRGKGPLGGLHAALQAAKFERVLLLAVDMPDMTSAYLRSLLEKFAHETGIVPEMDGFYQGLAAIYPKAILPLLEQILSGEENSFQNLCRTGIAQGLMKTRRVEESERLLFKNWNQPEDVL